MLWLVWIVTSQHCQMFIELFAFLWEEISIFCPKTTNSCWTWYEWPVDAPPTPTWPKKGWGEGGVHSVWWSAFKVKYMSLMSKMWDCFSFVFLQLTLPFGCIVFARCWMLLPHLTPQSLFSCSCRWLRTTTSLASCVLKMVLTPSQNSWVGCFFLGFPFSSCFDSCESEFEISLVCG